MRILPLLPLLSLLLAGCCSYVRLERDIPPTMRIRDEKPLATFYVQNISYQFLGLLPLCSGTTWQADDIPFEHANDRRLAWFRDENTLDNNIHCLKRACREVGSNRITGLCHNRYDSAAWSFFLLNRTILKTTCVILENQK